MMTAGSDRGRRAFGYVRVSKSRDDMISPEIQRDEITRFAEQKGWTVIAVYEDLDLSGRSWDRGRREGLNRLLDDALAGACDVVLFYRIDRLAREEADFHAILATLTRAGIHCDSPGNPNDGSPESALIWSISAALAKYESVKIGARLRDAHRRLAREGRWSGGPPPYGFKRVQDGNGVRLVAEPQEQEVRLWIHEKYHQGWGAQRIARALNQRGVPTQQGKTWQRATVEVILFRPIQVGAREVDGKLVFGGNIEAIVPLDIYQQTLAIREARRHKPQKGRPPRTPLTGRHVRCGTCGSRLYARYHRKPPVLYYTCHGRRQGLCDRGPAVKVDELISHVEERLFQRLKRAHAPRTRPPAPSIAPLREAVDQVEQALGRLASMYAAGELLEGEYRAARELQLKRLEKAERALERAIARTEDLAQADIIDATWEDLGEMTRAQWRALSVQAQRDIYDLVLDRVVVYPVEEPSRLRSRKARRIEVYWR
ncbi:MAG: recombinase family protein [Actinobacteria bacterium]|nr:recombinase family protein [Actinomycetota bacterium]